MTDLIGRLRAFEGSDELGNGDFSLLAEAAAEIEALRAEVERVTSELTDAATRADKLEEALRHQRWCRTCAEDGWESCEEGRKNDALLRDQEEGK